MLPLVIVLLGVPLIVSEFPLIEAITPVGRPVTFAFGTAPDNVNTIGDMSCPRQLFWVKFPLVRVTVAEGLNVNDPLV